MKELLDKIIAILTEISSDHNDLDYDDMEEIVDTIGRDIISWDYGATKYVLILRQYDFVLKIPRYERTKTNFCKLEVERYNDAISYGIEKILLPIQHLITINDLPIYIQLKYSTSYCELSNNEINKLRQTVDTISEQEICNISQEMNSMVTPATLWKARVAQLYGLTFLRKLVEWSNDYEVNDLHNSNYGFKNNTPVIFDYSGYFTEPDSDYSSSEF